MGMMHSKKRKKKKFHYFSAEFLITTRGRWQSEVLRVIYGHAASKY